jgi:hypothetical protein
LIQGRVRWQRQKQGGFEALDNFLRGVKSVIKETGIIPDVEAHADWDPFIFEADPSVTAAVSLLGHE